MNETNIVVNYLNAFSEKRLVDLYSMFAKDIKLIDWDNHIEGREEVILFNKQLFENIKRLEIYIDSISPPNRVMFAKIKLVADKQVIDIVDMITIENKQIKEIQAFKR